MRKILLTASLVALAAGCAPTATLFPEEDLARVLPGPGGTYRSSIPVPPVSLDELTHPDPRISEPAFRRLRTLDENIPINVYTPPEYSWRFGVYWLAKKDWQQAARWFDYGLKAMAGEASFDREGRDIWDYGYQRALAYLQYEPQKAVRDARILVRFAAPPVQGRMPQKLLGLELLVKAQVRTGDYNGALDTAQEYFKAWEELKGIPPLVQGFHSLHRVILERGKALEGLGRLDEARGVYRAILRASGALVESAVLKEAEERLKAGSERMKSTEATSSPTP